MARNPNSNRNGGAWTPEQINAVWQKGRQIPNYLTSEYRWDACGQVMKFSEHGNRNHEYGWEIDHINPVSNNGSDDISNIQPLNWKNNATKGDNLNWRCGQ